MLDKGLHESVMLTGEYCERLAYKVKRQQVEPKSWVKAELANLRRFDFAFLSCYADAVKEELLELPFVSFVIGNFFWINHYSAWLFVLSIILVWQMWGRLSSKKPPPIWGEAHDYEQQPRTFASNERGVGRDYCIPSTFRDEHQFNVTYFAPQIRRGIRHRLIRLDSTAPPQGICVP